MKYGVIAEPGLLQDFGNAVKVVGDVLRGMGVGADGKDLAA
jgi:hypothetical protein